MVAAGDTGRDYEHCLELQKKVNDTQDVSTSSLSVGWYRSVLKYIFRYKVYFRGRLRDVLILAPFLYI